jgi:E3 ubiquitin-protein ligase ZNF598
MSSTTTTAPAQINNAGSGQRGRRTNRGKGNNNKRGGKAGPAQSKPASGSTDKDTAPVADTTKVKEKAESVADDQDLCWICAEPVKYYSVSECNHRICHVCSLRLRALYKKRECTLCKVGVALVLIRS